MTMKNVLKFLCFFVCGLLLFSVTALAYVDPSAMTYMIQLVAGVIIAAGAAFGFYFRRIKRALSGLGKKKGARQDWQDDDAWAEDDGDDTGFGEYELEFAVTPTAGTAPVTAVQGTVTPAAGTAPAAVPGAAAASPVPSATTGTPGTPGTPGIAAPVTTVFTAMPATGTTRSADVPPADDRLTLALDEYDENGGEAGLLAENRELRRLLAEERQKVELLKQTLHICTASKT